MRLFGWFRKPTTWDRKREREDDPLTLAVNRAYNTGETVVWHEGDPLPDPEGKVRRIKRRRLS